MKGMHEWAMLYHPNPDSSPPPPSSKYQSHLSLRTSQQTINEQVERKGIRCTHIDALRFFAKDARKWNWYGSLDDLSGDELDFGREAKQNVKKHLLSSPMSTSQPTNVLTRMDQLHLEQKACLHANMDLFKISLRLSPFVPSALLVEALCVAIQARTLDVEASPYDVRDYTGLDWRHDKTEERDGGGSIAQHTGTRQLGAVAIETEHGRKEYKHRQTDIMNDGEIVRRKLLATYNEFIQGVFGIDEQTEIE
eukprot:scaffold1081_cov197-Alexandrium_tamarense.AAC.10